VVDTLRWSSSHNTKKIGPQGAIDCYINLLRVSSTHQAFNTSESSLVYQLKLINNPKNKLRLD